MRVLVVEDYEPMARAIVTGLRREGMAVDAVHDGGEALSHLALTRYDVVVLDRDLPGVPGDEVCRRMAATGHRAGSSCSPPPAASATGSKGWAWAPTTTWPSRSTSRATARVRALGRRAATPLPPVLEHGDLKLDPAGRTASRAGQRLALSAKEFAVLEYLLAGAGRVVSAEELLERVWDEAADPFTTAVKQTVHRLRAKLGDPQVIHTVREGGYRIGDH